MKKLLSTLIVAFAIASLMSAQQVTSAERSTYGTSASQQITIGFEEATPENRPQRAGVSALENDLVVTLPLAPTMIPTSQLATLSAQVSNEGTAAQTNVVLSATRGGTNLGQSTPIATLGAGSAQLLTITPPITPLMGANQVVFTVTQNETDEAPANNTVTRSFTGTDYTLAMDVYVESWILNNANCAGNIFPITANTSLNQVFWATENVAGTGGGGVPTYTISLFRMNDAGTGPVLPSVFTTDPLSRPTEVGIHTIQAEVPTTALMAGNHYFVCITPIGGAGSRIINNMTYTDQGRVFNAETGLFQSVNQAHAGADGTDGSAGAYVIRLLVGLIEDDLHLTAISPFLVPQIPLSQVAGVSNSHPFPNSLVAHVLNRGTASQNNLRLTATFGGTNLGTSPTIATLAPGAGETLSLTQDVVTSYPTTTGTFDLVLTLERELPDPVENNPFTFPLVVGNVFAFDNIDLSVSHPVAAGTGASNFGIGNVFAIHYPTTLTHVEIGFATFAGAEGDEFTVTVHRMTNATTRILAPVASSGVQTRPLGGSFTVELQEPLVLLPGVSYFVSVNHLPGVNNLAVLTDPRPQAMRLRQSVTQVATAVQTNTGVGAPAVRMIVDDNATLPPVFISTTPGNNARDIAIDTDIRFTFHEANLIEGDFDLITIYPAVTGVSANIVGNQLVISHGGFAFSTNYTVTLPVGTLANFNEQLTVAFRSIGDCQPITVFPWMPSFDATFFHPDCWTVHREYPAVSGVWQRNTAGPIAGTTAHIRHTNPGATEAKAVGWLVTPALQIPASGIYEFSFLTRWQLIGNLGRSEVWVSTGGTDISDFVLLYDIRPTPASTQGQAATNFEERAVSLEQFAGQTIHLAFRNEGRGIGLAATHWDITRIAVQQAPLRIVSTTPEAYRPGASAVDDIVVTFNRDISVAASLSGISISPAVAGFSPSLTDQRTLTISHDGLDYLTIYTVTILLPGLETTLVFRTGSPCAPVSTLQEHFAVVAGFPAFLPPDCWNIYIESPFEHPFLFERSTVSMLQGTPQLRHPAPHAAVESQTTWLIMPQIAVSAEAIYDLTFYTRWMTPANNEYTGVWVSTSTSDVSQFVEFQELLPAGGWQRRAISLEEFAGQTIYLAFKYVSRGVGLASTVWDLNFVEVARRPVLAVTKSPYDGEIDVLPNTDVRITFNQPITLLGTANAGITFDPPVAGVSASLENDITLVITTTEDLEIGVLYRITLANNVIEYFEGTTWTFTSGFPIPDFPDPYDFVANVVADRATLTWSHGEGVPAQSFNVFLTDLTTPYATNVTEMSFEFTNLAVGAHIVAVQAIGPTGLLSNIRPFSFDIAPPTVIARTPAVNAGGIALDAPISATFNHVTIVAENLAAITITPAVSGVSATIENGNVVTIAHGGFDYGTIYTVTIPAGTIAHVTQEISWSFRTIPYCNVPPTVASTLTENFEGFAFPPDCWIIHRENPAVATTWVLNDFSPRAGSTGHARSPASVAIYTNWFIIKPIEMPTTGTYSLRFFDRFTNGAAGGTFEVLVSTTTTDIAAFEIIYNVSVPFLPGLTSWRENTLSLEAFAGETIHIAFRVHSNSGTYWTATWDIDDIAIIPLPVAVASRTPDIDETNIPLNQDVTVVFNQPITATATPITGIVFNPAVTGVSATINDNVLTITHDGFDLGQAYTVTIPPSTIVGLGQPLTWSFTTTATSDLIVATRVPAIDATNVAIDTDVVLTFNQHITAGNLNLIQFTPAVANVQTQIVGRDLVISHGGFAFGETYTVTLPVGTINGLTTEVSWQFEAFSPAIAPWHEGFETTIGNNLPANWISTSATTWRTRASALGTAVIPPHSGFRQLTSERHDGGVAWAFSESVLLTEGTVYEISFAYLAPGNLTHNEPDNFRVRIGTGQSATAMTTTVFEQNTTYPTFIGEWTVVRYFFTPPTTGLFYLGIERLHATHTGNLIRIDDVRIEEPVPYRLDILADFINMQIPVSQFSRVSAQAVNTGTATQTNVMLSATLNGTPIGFSAPVATLAPLATSPVMTIVPTIPITEGPQTLVLTVEGSQAAGENNTATFEFTTTENVFARDTLTVPSLTGYGFLYGDGGGTFATVFEVTNRTTLDAIQLVFAQRGGSGPLVDEYTIHVIPMVGPMTASTTPLAQRIGIRVPGEINTLSFSDEGVIILEPGRYAVSITSRGFVDLSFDHHAAGGWYNLNLETGGMDFNLGTGAPGIRMVICDESLPRVPYAVTLTAPVNNAQNTSVTPTLTWYDETPAGSGATAVEYFVYFGTTAENLARIATVQAPTTAWTIATALPYYTTHYWRVIASNAQGVSEPSATWSFTTLEEDPTSLVETGYALSMQVFPNPVTDGFFYVEADDMRQIEIIDMLGRTVMQKNVNSSRERVDVPNLREGLYVVRVTTTIGTTLVRIVVQ